MLNRVDACQQWGCSNQIKHFFRKFSALYWILFSIKTMFIHRRTVRRCNSNSSCVAGCWPWIGHRHYVIIHYLKLDQFWPDEWRLCEQLPLRIGWIPNLSFLVHVAVFKASCVMPTARISHGSLIVFNFIHFLVFPTIFLDGGSKLDVLTIFLTVFLTRYRSFKWAITKWWRYLSFRFKVAELPD